MIQEVIRDLISGKDLHPMKASAVMNEIARGEATHAQIGGFLTALRLKGESASDIASFARVMQQYAVPVTPNVKGMMVDTCGTGGDSISSGGTFNISTAAAIVAAASGATVVKHGNRSVSSRCGSADLLEALGVTLDQSAEAVTRTIEKIGIGFMYAPYYHPAMRHVAQVRKELGVHTVFNILGPLLNPAKAPARLIGVYEPALVPLIAETMKELGVKRAMVVHGDGIDEITTTGATQIAELNKGEITLKIITPEGIGLRRADKSDLKGGTPEENALIIKEILDGKGGPGADIVALNAGAALYISGISDNLHDGVFRAQESIRTGAAAEKLADLVRISGSPV